MKKKLKQEKPLSKIKSLNSPRIRWTELKKTRKHIVLLRSEKLNAERVKYVYRYKSEMSALISSRVTSRLH